jgi:hypothetical protein
MVGAQSAGVHIKPRRAALYSGLILTLVVPLPILGTLIGLGVSNGSWPAAAVGELLCLVVALTGFWLFRSIWVEVSATHITERGLFRKTTRTPLSEVRSVVLAFTYNGSSNEVLPQLLIRDERDLRILRLRGLFWTEASMREVADAVGIPLCLAPEPLTSAQFFELYAGVAYWFENRRTLAIGGILIILAVCVTTVLGLMRILGLPIDIG